MINVLGIETSCDETAAAVVRGGSGILSNVVLSQVALHSPYGGVVPEIAARNHVENLPGIIEKAVSGHGLTWDNIDMVAVTRGPGLAGCLLAGVSAAKALAQRLEIPLAGINHLHAHIYSAFIDGGPGVFEKFCPFIVLLVSGGNTCIVRVDGPDAYCVMGKTLDDAAGEAFDKGANMLGLGYPGGPEIDRVSRAADPSLISFPEGRIDSEYCPPGLDSELCFSFSGVKTSLMYYLKKHPPDAGGLRTPDVAAAFQEAVIGVLIKKIWRALEKTGIRNLAVVGGVSLNSALRNGLGKMAAGRDVNLRLADKGLCGDNAAMVAAIAGAWNTGCVNDVAAMDIDPSAGITPTY